MNEFTQDVCAFWNGRAELGQLAGTRDVIAKQLEVDAISTYVRDGMRILEVGCGNGITAIVLARRHKVEILGIDFAAEMIAAVGSMLAGLGGALQVPRLALTTVMDTTVIVEAFVVVVIGGLGSFWGTFLGALIYGQVLSFGILFFPRFSIFSMFALMAAVLIIRPWGLLGKPLK